jgi:hypothetical protein
MREPGLAEHRNVGRLRRALEARRASAVTGEDRAVLEDVLADHVVWHGVEGVSGKAGVIEHWNAFARRADSGSSIAVGAVYADGLHAAALLELSLEGRVARQANIFHIDGNGRIAAIWGLPSEQAIVGSLASGRPVPEHPRLATFLAAEKARQRSEFGPDDVATIRRFLADDVVWHMGGETEFAKAPPTSTIAEVIGKFKMFKEATGGTLFFDIHDVYADDVHAASFVTLVADHPYHPDRHMNVDEVNIFHYDAAGRAFEFWGIPTDEAERDAFWAP